MSAPGLRSSFVGDLAGNAILPGERIALIVAHPDDETLGLGAQMARMPGLTIAHATDGAPRDLGDAARRGFASADAYAAARREELEAAVALAGIPADALLGLGFADQDACNNLVPLALTLAEFIAERRFEVILTHAYEGGHPDHDAIAFAVSEAVRLLAARSRTEAPLVVEMPYYRLGPEGLIAQSFPPDPAAPELALWLTPAERAMKRRMYDAHASQAEVLAGFPIACERFRVAPRHDFDALPNGGLLNYERFEWGLTGERWLALVAQARSTLAEGPP